MKLALAPKLSIRKLFDLDRDGATQSIITTWMQCRRKAKLKLEGWSPIRVSLPLTFGSMAHHVFAEVYSRFKSPPPKEAINELLEEFIRAESKERAGRMGATEAQVMETCAAILLVELPLYFEFWKEDFQKLTWTRIEANFATTPPGFPFKQRGRFDRVFRLTKDKSLWLLESKTKGRIEEEVLMEMLHFDFQNGYYILALRVETGEWPKGIMYDVMRRPGQKQGKDESLQDFAARIEVEIKKDPKHYFKRYPISLDRKEMQESQAEIEQIAAEFARWYRAGQSPSWRNSTACKTSYGSCEYLPICSRQDYGTFFQRKTVFPELAKP